ncbi:hypothetical protein K525DRAFT_273693 [Schizophyllum commune Loenen D]|nr:hypothetical protein K525DRAFT_273693 [Schizophyllum commune Loenen D]
MRAHQRDADVLPEAVQQHDEVRIQHRDIDVHNVEDMDVITQAVDTDDYQADVEDERTSAEDQHSSDEDQRANNEDRDADIKNELDERNQLSVTAEEEQVSVKDEKHVPDVAAPEATAGAEPKTEAFTRTKSRARYEGRRRSACARQSVGLGDQLPVAPVDTEDRRNVEDVDAEDQRPVKPVHAEGQPLTPPLLHLANVLAQEVVDKQVPDSDGDQHVFDNVDSEWPVPNDEDGQATAPEAAAAGTELNARAAEVDDEVRAPVEPVEAEEQRPVEPVDVEDQRPAAPIDAEEQLAAELVDPGWRSPSYNGSQGAVSTELPSHSSDDSATNQAELFFTVGIRASSGYATQRVPRRICPSLCHLGNGNDVIEINVEAGRLDMYLDAARFASDDGRLAPDKYRSLSAQALPLSELVSVCRVAGQVQDVTIRNDTIRLIEDHVAGVPLRNLQTLNALIIPRQHAAAVDIATWVDCAHLVVELGMDWLLLGILDTTLRVKALNIDISQHFKPSGCTLSVSLPSSVLGYIARAASAASCELLQELRSNRVTMHLKNIYVPRRCSAPMLDQQVLTDFLKRVSGDPDYLGLEPLSKEMLALGQRALCSECVEVVTATDMSWTMRYYSSLPRVFGLNTTLDNLICTRACFFNVL